MSADGVVELEILLRVTYKTVAGGENTLRSVHNIKCDLDTAVRGMFQSTDINLDDYRFLNDVYEEETLTFANGKPVHLDMLSPVDLWEEVAIIDGQVMQIIDLTMIRKS